MKSDVECEMRNEELNSRQQFQIPNSKFLIEVLASGSKANCYALCDGTATILLECGLPYHKTLERLNWKLPDAILITHEHGDHASCARNFLERGVEMYMTAGTADALKLSRHNLHIIKPDEKFTVCGHEILPVKVKHDAAEPVNFTIDDEILFVTDAGEVPNVSGNFRQVFIEANYETLTLLAADISTAQKERVRENHLSIRQAVNFLKTLTEPDEIWLIHLSKRHGDGEEFIREVKAATGFKNVFTAEVSK